jgi:Arc/MetJ-type ribon-helix-helix transcriptional regulator
MNIRLTPEQEKIVKEELESGHFRTIEEVVGHALRALREKAALITSGGPTVAEREAVREMIAFAENNHVRLEGTSVKELIHEGRRF